MKKKILAACLAISMVFGCAGCSVQELLELTEQLTFSEPTEPTEATKPEPSTAYKEVTKLLEDVQLPETAASVVVGDPFAGMSESRFYAAHVLQAMRERESNPIALFHKLVNKGLYQKEDQTDGFTVEVSCDSKQEADNDFQRIPSVIPWAERNETNPEVWLREVLQMTAFHPADYLSMGLLNAFGGDPVFHYSDAPGDDCYYYYSISSDGFCSADIMAVYLPQTEDGHPEFRDIQIQFLSLYSRPISAGFSVAMEMERQAWTTQTAAMICAVEKLMTGSSFIYQEDAYDGFHHEEYARYQLPGSYDLGDYQVEITSTEYTCTNADEIGSNIEIARLVNYRIHK